MRDFRKAREKVESTRKLLPDIKSKNLFSVENIDHIGIKVSGLSHVRDTLENLGIGCNAIEKHEEVGMQIAFLGRNETSIELLEVINPASPIYNDPPGLHHIALKVDNIDEMFKNMKLDTKYKVESEIRRGAHSRIFFFRIEGEEETLFECVE